MTDPTWPMRRHAAALRYVPGESPVPQVVATGDGQLAERIIALAREHGIPIHENPDLVRLLAQLPPETAIPPELYVAVAEVIAFLLRTRPPLRETRSWTASAPR